MNLSSSLALLVSAIAGAPKAAALDITDFKKVGTGNCKDSANNFFTGVQSPPVTYSSDAAMNGFCVSWCGQNLPTAFRGFSTTRKDTSPTDFRCACEMAMPTGPTPIPLSYTPNMAVYTYNPGTGQITTTTPYVSGFIKTCYSWLNTNTGTASPTGANTPAPTAGPVGPSDFTRLGGGYCVDSAGAAFSEVTSPVLNWAGLAAAETTCTGWCGQNTNSNFRGFELVHDDGDDPFYCNCLFDLPNQAPPYSYNPTEDGRFGYPGTGAIVRTGGSDLDYSCYRWNGTTGNVGGSKSAKNGKSGKTSTKSTKVAKRV